MKKSIYILIVFFLIHGKGFTCSVDFSDTIEVNATNKMHHSHAHASLLDENKTIINEMQLDSDFKKDMLILLDTYNKIFRSKLDQASNAIEDENFAAERVRQVEERLGEINGQITPLCKKLSENILGSDKFTQKVELSFLRFKEQCL